MRPASPRRMILRRSGPLLAATLLLVGLAPSARAIEVDYGDVRLDDSAAIRAVAAIPRGSGPVAPAPTVDEAFIREMLGGRDDFYRLGILADGFPGRRVRSVVVAHPIYGTYVLAGYLRRYASAPSPQLAAGMLSFAKLAIGRMERFGDALVMRNPPELGFIRSPGRRYSGLTMAYYALYLAAVGRITGDPSVTAAAGACFRGLLVPEREGGVLYRLAGGKMAFAEIPGRPADLTLNGWLSILVSIHDYAQLTGDATASAAFRNSAGALAKLLPLYDIRERNLSRYALSGAISLRLRLSDPRAVTLVDPTVVIPGDDRYPISVGGASKWVNHFRAADVVRVVTRTATDGTTGGRTDGTTGGRTGSTAGGASIAGEISAGTTGSEGSLVLRPRRNALEMSVVISRVTYPTPNAVEVTIRASRRVTVTLDALAGRWDPRASSQVDLGWKKASAATVGPGETTLLLPIPWSLAADVGPPTNWAHLIEGRAVNIYHAIHVRRLEELYEMFAVSRFATWARIWRADICAWASLPVYRGLYVTGDGGGVVKPAALCP